MSLCPKHFNTQQADYREAKNRYERDGEADRQQTSANATPSEKNP